LHDVPRQELQHFQTVRALDTATWIQELSRYTTLQPGDVLWMGTEGADGDRVAGDVIEVESTGIGILRNRVVAEE
jgi:2-keto-4-pentenoate hydratase/2-oxohepta-3-ene-1,7-dioic acid hydratase in catechol pathway